MKSVVIAAVILFLLVAWAIDHTWQAAKYDSLQRELIPMAKLHALDRSLERVRKASTEYEFWHACDAASASIKRCVEDPVCAKLGVCAYVRAIGVADRDGRVSQVAVDGSEALASLGRDGLPVAIGLLSDEDVRVRKMAVETLLFMMDYSEWSNPKGRQLSANDEARVLRIVKCAQDGEEDGFMAARLETLRDAIQERQQER